MGFYNFSADQNLNQVANSRPLLRKGYCRHPEVGYLADELRPLLEVRLPQFVVFLFDLEDFFARLLVESIDLVLNLVDLFNRLLLFFICKQQQIKHFKLYIIEVFPLGTHKENCYNHPGIISQIQMILWQS